MVRIYKIHSLGWIRDTVLDYENKLLCAIDL